MIPIFVLNLERAEDRKNSMIKQFINLGMKENKDYFFIPAYDGINITNFSFNVNIGMGYGAGRKFEKGEIAIIISQLAAIKFAQMLNFENIIIIEDDVVLCEDWNKRLETLFSLLPNDWEHVYLSGHSDYVKFNRCEVPTIIPSPKMVGAFSYMLNKRAYARISKFCMSFLTTYDDMIMHMIDQNKLNSYAYFPFMSFHDANNSFVWDESGKQVGHLTSKDKIHSSYYFFKSKI